MKDRYAMFSQYYNSFIAVQIGKYWELNFIHITLGQAKLIITFPFPPLAFSLYGNLHRMDFSNSYLQIIVL